MKWLTYQTRISRLEISSGSFHFHQWALRFLFGAIIWESEKSYKTYEFIIDTGAQISLLPWDSWSQGLIGSQERPKFPLSGVSGQGEAHYIGTRDMALIGGSLNDRYPIPLAVSPGFAGTRAVIAFRDLWQHFEFHITETPTNPNCPVYAHQAPYTNAFFNLRPRVPLTA